MIDPGRVERDVAERRRRLAGADWGGVGRGVLLVVVGVGLITLPAPARLFLLASVVVVLSVDFVLARRARRRRPAVAPAGEQSKRRRG